MVDRRHLAEMFGGGEHIASLVEVTAHADGTVVSVFALCALAETGTRHGTNTLCRLGLKPHMTQGIIIAIS